MATSRKIIPASNKIFFLWMLFTRAAQILITVAIIGLDAFVINEWNRNQLNFNSAIEGGSSNVNIKTWVGGTPFTGVVMFTVSHRNHTLLRYYNMFPQYITKIQSERDLLAQTHYSLCLFSILSLH